MKLGNQTPLPAELLRTAIDDHRIAAAVVAKATFDMSSGEPRLADEQAWKVAREPLETEHGVIDPEQPCRREGVDLFLFGNAYGARGRKTIAQEVRLEVGTFSRRVVAVGDRVWRKSLGNLIPSDARPFESMPLTLAGAFGGSTFWDGLELKHPENPAGKGFYGTLQEAVDKPLPNIEEADMLVRKWDDRPTPAGLTFCPMTSALRLSAAFQLDENNIPVGISRRLFNAAFPRMITPAVSPGEPVRLQGVSPSGPLAWSIPQVRPTVRLRFDEERIEQPLQIDQVGFEPEKKRMFVSYRFVFRYVIHPGQLRECALVMA
jgi:hypothetical protein